MMKGNFFTQKDSQLQTTPNTKNTECCIQVPSSSDIDQLHRMPAGAEEDQYLRLKHMTHVIAQVQSTHTSLAVIDTNQASLPPYWIQLFALMKEGKADKALAHFATIPEEDVILKALLAVHSANYLQRLIFNCMEAKKNKGYLSLNADILITEKTFEVLIKDIATTLYSSDKVHFSFGLPSHHAFQNEGSGFCVLNKTAVLMKHTQSASEHTLKYIIVGTDVNRDNGLCKVLLNTASDMDVCHIDVFDSRVYPCQDAAFISREFKHVGNDVGQKIRQWEKGSFEYYAVDLSMTKRKSGLLHPALVFALDKIKEQIEDAKAKKQKIALFLPTGWDSHENETAPCGKYVNGRMMSRTEAKETRFNDTDLAYFYEGLFELYQENKEYIEKMYWGLEGGYDHAMYEKQVQLLMSFILEGLVNQDVKQLVADRSSNGLGAK